MRKNAWRILLVSFLALFFTGNITLAQTNSNKCYIGDQEVTCPNIQSEGNGQYANNISSQPQADWRRDILPQNFMADARNDVVFYSAVVAVFIFFLILGIFKIRIFGRTLNEYIFPIWYYILGSILVVISQYLVVAPHGGQFHNLDRITQALWALFVALSVCQLVKKSQFNFGNIIFLGIIYSFIIHGLKVIIRYAFYEKTLFYTLDRFIYGSLLVMIIVVIIGATILLLRKKNVQIS